MGYKGEIGNFTFEKQDDGTFLYKAKENFVSFAKKSTKTQFKEKPQFKLIEQYERKSVERYQDNLKGTVKQVATFLNTIQNG